MINGHRLDLHFLFYSFSFPLCLCRRRLPVESCPTTLSWVVTIDMSDFSFSSPTNPVEYLVDKLPTFVTLESPSDT